MKKVCFYPSCQKRTNHFLFNLAKLLESSGNFQCVSYKEMKKEGSGNLFESDVYHINWFDQSKTFFSFLKRLYFLLALKQKNKRIVWTIHNIVSHVKTPFYNKILFMLLARFSSVIHVMCEDTLTIAHLEKYAGKVKLVPHGDYYGSYPESDLDVRKKFGIDERSPIMLFSGAIQPYKNIEVLVKAFMKAFGENENVELPVLLICGKVEPASYEADIRNLIGNCKRIVFNPGFIPDDELSAYVKSACVMTVPYSYRSSLNSGTIPLAFSLGKTLICPDIACVKDILKQSDCLYGYHYESESEHVEILAEKMAEAYSDFVSGKIGEKESLAVQYMARNSWESHKKEWLELYGETSC